ncbi:MAG: hypothetical protein QG670_410 [Thermoproteota archaeon]|nr:hypothetical protein [Thermoproteota archaeon]
MSSTKLFSIDLEVHQFNFILGIGVHTTSSLHTDSSYESKLFVAQDLSPQSEKQLLEDFLEYLTENRGACLTSYNLMGLDLPILLSRLREYYPLGLQFSDIIYHSSLYDTMIAYKTCAQNQRFCKLVQAIQDLQRSGQKCFILSSKLVYSGKDTYQLWIQERNGTSKEFSKYINEDSYNHLRLAQVLLSKKVSDGFWNAKNVPQVPPEILELEDNRSPEEGVMELKSLLTSKPLEKAYAGKCPKCGSHLVWRKARITNELYRGCTNYPKCKYNERSYKFTPPSVRSKKNSHVNEDASEIYLYDGDDSIVEPDDSHFYGYSSNGPKEWRNSTRVEENEERKEIRRRLKKSNLKEIGLLIIAVAVSILLYLAWRLK